MKNIYKISITTIFALLAVFSFASAQGDPINIEFPISELGNCDSVEECKVYCDDSSNIDACIAWADDNGFNKPIEQSTDVRKLIEEGGPGGCNSLESCDAFCAQPKNGDECLAFSKDHSLIPQEELERIEEMRSQIHNINGPGGCSSREECDSFCRNPDNSKICLQFAVDGGNISQEEADFIIERFESHIDFKNRGSSGPVGLEGTKPRGPEGSKIDEEKAIELISTVGGPGGCSTFGECDTFCSTSENDQVCMDYAVEHRLIPEEEIEKIQKMMNIVGPGGCRGERECHDYCGQIEHGDECFTFAKENNLISEDEIRMMEKEMGIMKKLEGNGGPGGCRGERECHDYCSDHNNIDECMAFAVDAGVMPVDRVKDIMEGFINIDKFGGLPEGGRFVSPSGDLKPLEEYSTDVTNYPSADFEGDKREQYRIEYDRQFNEEFEKRFKDFEQFRGEFERRENGDFPNPSFNNDREFPISGEFPVSGEFPTQNNDRNYPDGNQFPTRDYSREYPNSEQFPIVESDNRFPQEGTTIQGEIPEEFRNFPPREGGGYIPPDGFRNEGVKSCPGMPTVDVCPPGQKKEVMFDSSECGTYYGCVPEKSTSSGVVEYGNSQEGFVESWPAGEFNRQFEGEFDRQPEDGFERPTGEFMPPEGFDEPHEFMPPEGFIPPESVSLNDNMKPQKSLLGSVIDAFLGLFN